MQVVCGNCQLNFDAPDGATGLLCPICRSPLRPEAAGDGAGKAAAEPVSVEWSGGTLDDLISLLSAPAVSARVEVMPAAGGAAVGEVHLLAGGVSDALWGGKSTDDALEQLRGVVPARFKIEPRLPNPANGDLGERGPDSGTLDARPLAHLMRYCEDYVITCSIEVWRGNENARVEYKRGEISGVTIGGIDAPERLAEVMQWASGNYRLVVPTISLPAVAPRRPTPVPMVPTPVPAPAASAQAARGASATKTIFGIPQSDIAAARAAAAEVTGSPAAPPAAQAAAPAAAAPKAAPAAPPVVPPSAAPAPPVAAAAAAAAGKSATKTIFGVPVPKLPDGFIPGRATPVGRTLEAGVPTPAPSGDSGRTERKTGARKVGLPAPEISPPSPSAAPPPAPAPAAAAASASAASASAPPPVPADVARATQQGYDPARVQQAASKKAEEAADATTPTRLPAPRPRETPIVTYVGLGFLFGLALLAVYQLVGRLAH